jgi:hypothetical protein
VAVAALGLVLTTPHSVQAKTFHCGAGDVACLIDAITEANANGQEHHTIRLEAGTYTLTDVDHPTGGNGLPSITSTLTIQGAGAETTVIERAPNAPLFRILQVAAAGSLALKGLTLHGGSTGLDGGGIFNFGTLALTHTTVDHNGSSDGGGGLFNAGGTVTITHTIFTGNGAVHGGGGLRNQGGTMTIAQTTIARNGSPDGGGGLWIDSGTVTITDSTFVDNDGGLVGGGGLLNFSGGVLTITNSTVAHNQAEGRLFGGGGLANNSGTTRIINSTFAENSISFTGTGGIETSGGTVELQNTILAHNTAGPISQAIFGPDCFGPVTSLGNNLIGDPTGCTITLQGTDLTGDPGLDTFTDNGTPGNGHFPLLSTSQAIDAGNDATCPRRDQLGKRRVGPCDIGAIAFRDQDDCHDEEDPVTADQEAQRLARRRGCRHRVTGALP